MRTHDFELEINPGEGGAYSVTARAPGGEAATSMRLPLTLDELDRQLEVVGMAVLASSATSRRAATQEEQPVRQLGRRLFESLIADDVRALYVASTHRARDEGTVLRLVLRIRPPELARMPWEFLFDEGRQDYLGLSLPVVRYPQVLAPQQPLRVAAPLRILGMIARPGDQQALDVDDEQRRLQAAVRALTRDGLVDLEWVHGQTFGDLEDALDRGPWHVFHFIGHGGYDPDRDEGTIVLADEQGRSHVVGAEDISRLLGDHYTMRLAVLNACDTGRGSAFDVFSSTASSLVRRGVPAVVAMQFPITDPAAIKFAQTFYQNVAKRLSVDTSVMRARRALCLDKKDTLEWGTPVLYLRAPDGRIFDTATDIRATPIAPRAHVDDRGGRSAPAATPEVDGLYSQALAAYWTEQWEEAVDLFRQLIAYQRDYPDAPGKLEHARRQLQLATRYAEACAAAGSGDWESAVHGFTMVADSDPSYQDVTAQLAHAHRQREIADLRNEARRLHRAEQWAAVLKVGDRLKALDPAEADPDGLMASARSELDRTVVANRVAADFDTSLRLIDAGRWGQALEILEGVVAANPEHRHAPALLARVRRELAASTQPQRHSPINIRPNATQLTIRHDKPVNAVTFSPDGQLLATACADRSARIWDVATGRQQLAVRHGSWRRPVCAVALSPDGRRLATAADSTACIWDTTTGETILELPHPNMRVSGVAFSPDGRLLATASCRAGVATARPSIRIWDTADGSQRGPAYPYPHRMAYAVAFDPDGRRLAIGGAEQAVRVWDTVDAQQVLKVVHEGVVLAVAFSPDGHRLASAGDDNTARVWDATDGTEIFRLTHDNPVLGLAFSPDGRVLLTGGNDNTARLWDTHSGQEIYRFNHSKPVNGVAFSPDGRRIATACGDNVARILAVNDDE